MKKIVIGISIILGVLYSTFRMYGEYYHWNVRTNIYHFAKPLAKRIHKKIYNQKPFSILVLEDTYNLFLRYYFKNESQPSEIKIDVLLNQLTNKPIDYQIIILPKETSFPSQIDKSKYSVFYQDDFVIAYLIHSVTYSLE